MDTPITSYVFDDQGMTWITCDMCSGSFRRSSNQKCAICGGTKLRRVSYDYLVNVTAPPQNPQGNIGGGGPSSVSREGNRRNNGQGPSSGSGVYSRSS